MPSRTTMPSPSDRGAPYFSTSSSKADKFDKFFDAVQLLCDRHNIRDGESVKWAIRYAGSSRRLWKNLPHDNRTKLSEFRRTVAKFSPILGRKDRCRNEDLEKLVKDTKRLASMDLDDYGFYYRTFTTYAGYLINKDRLSNHQKRLSYLKGLPGSLRRKVTRQLEHEFPHTSAHDGYPLSDVHEAVLQIFKESDYVQRGHSRSSSSSGSRSSSLLNDSSDSSDNSDSYPSYSHCSEKRSKRSNESSKSSKSCCCSRS